MRAMARFLCILVVPAVPLVDVRPEYSTQQRECRDMPEAPGWGPVATMAAASVGARVADAVAIETWNAEVAAQVKQVDGAQVAGDRCQGQAAWSLEQHDGATHIGTVEHE